MTKERVNTNHTFAICAYKESPYLEECITSLMEQTVKSEIFIATSTPNKYIDDIAAKYNLKVYVNDGESGITQDWNFAYSKVQTDYVTIAHQDDVSTIWGIDRQDLLAALVKERFQWSNILGTQLIKTYDSGKVAENGYYYRNMYFEQTAPNDIQNRLKSNRLDKLGRDYYG